MEDDKYKNIEERVSFNIEGRGAMTSKESEKNEGRPQLNGTERNQPNYSLMAKAFINLYKEVESEGTVES